MVVAVIDLVREVFPPLSPELTVVDYVPIVADYGMAAVHGDRYGKEWTQEQFRKRGIEYIESDKTKSEIYASFLPMLNSNRVELLDNKRLIAQLASLERRVARGSGREVIDHPTRGEHHDDVANVVALTAILVSARPPHRARAGFGWVSREEREKEPLTLADIYKRDDEIREWNAMVAHFSKRRR